MRKINILLALIILFTQNGCQEVVSVNLDTEAPKLVIEAPLIWQKGTSGSLQRIKLSTTTSFFSSAIPTVSGAQIVVKNSAGTPFVFTELGSSGVYFCFPFIPAINEVYTLTINLNGTTYTATETLKSVAPIEEVTQRNDAGFSKMDIQIKTFFTDPAEETNNYLFQYAYKGDVSRNIVATDDKFFNGNPFFSLSQRDKLKAGDEITVTHYGISKNYKNYLEILSTIAGSNNGGPFQTPPATVRGNIINNTNKDDFPLGYFSVSETDSRTYVVK